MVALTGCMAEAPPSEAASAEALPAEASPAAASSAEVESDEPLAAACRDRGSPCTRSHQCCLAQECSNGTCTSLVWRNIAPTLDLHTSCTAATSRGHVFVLNSGVLGADRVKTGCERYDPEANAWTHIADSPIELAGAEGATGHDGRIYVAGAGAKVFPDGGFSPTGDKLAIYDPKHDRWTLGADLLVPAVGAAVAADRHGRIYAFGGVAINQGTLNDGTVAQRYHPRTNRWQRIADPPHAHESGQAVRVHDGRIFVISDGFRSGKPNADRDVDVYDPDTGTWESVASLPQARAGAAVALGGDGNVYTFSGRLATDLHQPSALSLVYDRKANTWVSVPGPGPVVAACATLGPGRRTYLFGGFEILGQPEQRAQVLAFP